MTSHPAREAALADGAIAGNIWQNPIHEKGARAGKRNYGLDVCRYTNKCMEEAALVMVRPDGRRSRFQLNSPVVTLGRSHKCNLRIPLSNVSREHCQFEWRQEQGHWYLVDLGSSNGTLCNKKPVDEAALCDGDLIVVGPAIFTVELGPQETESEEAVSVVIEEPPEPVDESAETIKIPPVS